LSSSKGLFIVLEGIDGAGKSTQLSLISGYLQLKFNERLKMIREPGGSSVGEEIRKIIYGEDETGRGVSRLTRGVLDLLFLAAHIQNSKKVVDPWLAENNVILSDRWWISQFAYCEGREYHPDVLALYDKMKGVWPDLVIFLYGDPFELCKRAEARADGIQQRKTWSDPLVQQRIGQKYFDLYSGRDGWFPICVNGKEPMEIFVEIRHMIDHKIEEWSGSNG
jgi:dTMP kinase